MFRAFNMPRLGANIPVLIVGQSKFLKCLFKVVLESADDWIVSEWYTTC